MICPYYQGYVTRMNPLRRFNKFVSKKGDHICCSVSPGMGHINKQTLVAQYGYAENYCKKNHLLCPIFRHHEGEAG